MHGKPWQNDLYVEINVSVVIIYSVPKYKDDKWEIRFSLFSGFSVMWYLHYSRPVQYWTGTKHRIWKGGGQSLLNKFIIFEYWRLFSLSNNLLHLMLKSLIHLLWKCFDETQSTYSRISFKTNALINLL